MAKAIYFDCFSGISGDMALGALLDAGLAIDALRAELDKLDVPGWTLHAERGTRSFITGTRALVHAPEQPVHRHLADLNAIIAASTLAPQVKQRSLDVFARLAAAEGQVHGIAPEQVHFHEVGALDAIVDIVGVVAGLDLLGVEAVYASALPLGGGWTRAAHGALPLPAPAVLALLAGAGAPTLPDDTPFELVTPTGAALLAELAEFRRPPMRLERIGYGLGKRDLERPNVLRIWLGETPGETRRQGDGETGKQGDKAEYDLPISLSPDLPVSSGLVLLETNIDDQPAEQIAYAAERLLEIGALDAWLAPIYMKKGRPATLLAALVPAAIEQAAVGLIMRETSTLGVRRRPVERHVCEREIATVDTPLGQLRVKRKRWLGADMGVAPEYEDCARLARAHNLPIREVYQLAIAAAEQAI